MKDFIIIIVIIIYLWKHNESFFLFENFFF